MDHRTIVSFFTCQLVWVNRYRREALIKDGKEAQFVISIPDDKSLRIDKEETNELHQDIKIILGLWLSNAFGVDTIVSWHDSNYATQLIKTRSNR